MDDQLKGKWEKGKNNTLRFYKAKLPWKEKQFNHAFPLYPYFDPMIGSKKEVKIADVGCGMFCTIGSTWPNTKVEVYPSDALATEFNQILAEAKVKVLIPVKYEDMEKLSYKDNFFDIVNCCNALDHTSDPIRAISEMYRVTKPGGFTYLRHFPNVGESERYAGLHIWNLDIDNDGHCIIWNKNGKFVLNEIYKNIISVKKQELDYEPNNMVVCIIQKI
jgi:ubiquinone/menaquinone biosynthesis C-methylase UbiE